MVGEQYHKSSIICTAKYDWFAAVSVHPYLKDRKEDLNEEEKETELLLSYLACVISLTVLKALLPNLSSRRDF